MPRAVVLLSGGLDSTVTAAQARADGFELVALTVSYGQRHVRELESARAVAKALAAIEHHELDVDLGAWGGSSLMDQHQALPLDRPDSEIAHGIPSTYVPARNTVLLSLALSLAEAVDAGAIYIGANAVDYSGYPDCRPEFINQFNKLAEVGTKRGTEGNATKIVAPLIAMSKAEIVERGEKLDAPIEQTWSCYAGGEVQCGRCDSCKLRRKGFAEAGVKDPVAYAT